jgi:hypothetical protein
LKRVLIEVPRNVAPWAYGATGIGCAIVDIYHRNYQPVANAAKAGQQVPTF